MAGLFDDPWHEVLTIREARPIAFIAGFGMAFMLFVMSIGTIVIVIQARGNTEPWQGLASLIGLGAMWIITATFTYRQLRTCASLWARVRREKEAEQAKDELARKLYD